MIYLYTADDQQFQLHTKLEVLSMIAIHINLFRQAKPNSHSKIGWSEFTDATIQAINAGRNGVVFLLWGNFAKKKAAFVNRSKHIVIEVIIQIIYIYWDVQEHVWE